MFVHATELERGCTFALREGQNAAFDIHSDPGAARIVVGKLEAA